MLFHILSKIVFQLVESENEFKSDNDDDDNEFVEVEENIPIGRCRALYDFPGWKGGEWGGGGGGDSDFHELLLL